MIRSNSSSAPSVNGQFELNLTSGGFYSPFVQTVDESVSSCKWYTASLGAFSFFVFTFLSSHNRRTVMDFVNSKDNGTYLWNLAHFVSVLADNVIFCCGDLLPLLSSVTSRDYGQDVIEPCGGMTLETSFSFLNRLMSLVDVIVFTSSLAFSGVETNRNMSTGGFLRQCLRLGESNTDKMSKHSRGEKNRQRDRYADSQTDRQRYTDSQTDRQIDTQTVRQTDRRTDVLKDI